jgi:hypothetical protein
MLQDEVHTWTWQKHEDSCCVIQGRISEVTNIELATILQVSQLGSRTCPIDQGRVQIHANSTTLGERLAELQNNSAVSATKVEKAAW